MEDSYATRSQRFESFSVSVQISNAGVSRVDAFPKEERYSLTDQIRRSSRSVPSNIAEGFRKRRYPKMFISKFADADGESSETQVWLDFARDCGYLGAGPYAELTAGYEEVGKMLGSMIAHPEKFRAL